MSAGPVEPWTLRPGARGGRKPEAVKSRGFLRAVPETTSWVRAQLPTSPLTPAVPPRDEAHPALPR